MTKIILPVINAKYIHTSLGARYLYANLKELKCDAKIIEFALTDEIHVIIEKILYYGPTIVGFGVYIWNVDQILKIVETIKLLRPKVCIIVGGPEVSYEYEKNSLLNIVDHLVIGEGEIVFYELCRNYLDQKSIKTKVIKALPVNLKNIEAPYYNYTKDDIENRILYVESSRGCPFHCEFCLSSIDKKVRYFDLTNFINQIEYIWKQGGRSFKFIDRTFNLDKKRAISILNYFLKKNDQNFFLHFEIVPELLSDDLKKIISLFPLGSIQFEVGIQTFNLEVSKRIGRKLNKDRVLENIRFLIKKTNVHLHTDLIIGLPGESFESFASGFDLLLELNPQEIQIGILKRLKGALISRHDKNFKMKYNLQTPYDLLENNEINFQLMRKLSRFSRYWDLFYNNGNFIRTLKLLWTQQSPFMSFFNFSIYLYDKLNRTYKISLDILSENLYLYLIQSRNLNEDLVLDSIIDDYIKSGRKDLPKFIRKKRGYSLKHSKISKIKLGNLRQNRQSF